MPTWGAKWLELGVVEAPQAIDLAMQLTQNYPRGPLRVWRRALLGLQIRDRDRDAKA